MIAKNAIIRPILNAPESPINIFAGGLLNIKKASNAPISDNEIILSINELLIKNIQKNIANTYIPVEDDNPSKPSIRLYALIKNRITEIENM